jgi:2-polyprenyl-6-methoxyphenol hydroxylase-like FAD-dependent oxidoreductase
MNPATHNPDPVTDVLIIGAGPTGLALATTLNRAGVSTLILDKLDTGQNTSRAAVIHAHTLEVLDAIGASKPLAEQGLKLSHFTLRDRDRKLVQLNFDELPSNYPHLLMIPQDVTESILRDALAGAKQQVRWGTSVEAVRETADGVDVAVQSTRGRETLRARYVVGADGMNSLVRRTANIGFSGSNYEDSFVLADVDMKWELGRDEVMLFFSPNGPLVVAPLPNGRFRLVATLDRAPEKPGVEHMQALLDARGPTKGAAKISAVHWSSRFRLQHRVADRYRSGRLFLVGDAAHVHSPAGGQGMNTGLVDAIVLGQTLTEVIQGRRGAGFLDEYEKLRRPAAMKVLELAGRLTNMATYRSSFARFMRNIALRIVNHLPKAREKLQMNLSGLSRRAAAVLPN